jgi:hypothetical protein
VRKENIRTSHHQYYFNDVNGTIFALAYMGCGMINKYQKNQKAGKILGIFCVFRNVFNTFLIMLLISHTALADENSARNDDKANRIVSGIISFTRWPELTQPPQLCVFSSAQHLSLPQNSAPSAIPFSVVYLASDGELASQHCDAVYFGDQSPAQQVELLKQFKGKAVLTLAENNAKCTIGAAFCLIFTSDHPLFSVNLDSLARSGVKVSPDVLLQSRNGSK